MRMTLMGFLVGAGLFAMFANGTAPQPAQAQRTRELESERDIQAIPLTGENGQQLLVLIDSAQRSLASYQVDGKSGQITLRCVRNFRWDLQLDDYYGTEPSPEKIQKMLQTNR